MKEEGGKMIELQKQDKSMKCPVFSGGLMQLKKVIEEIQVFMTKLKKRNVVKLFLSRNKIADQFNCFSERLDTLQNTVHLGVSVEMIGMVGRVIDDTQMNPLAGLGESFQKSKKVLNQRIDEDRDDEVKDNQELLEKMKGNPGGREIDLEKAQKDLEEAAKWLPPSKSGYSVDQIKIIKQENLKFEAKIGAGSMGTVYKATFNRYDVAVKKLQPQRSANIREVKRALRKEAENLKRFDSNNVVRLWGLCEEKDGPTSTLMIIMEYMKRGTLKETLQTLDKKEGRDNIDWSRRVHMALGGALGLYRIHSMVPPMLHCCIDSKKFLVDRSYEVKIADLGFVHTRTSSGKNHEKRSIGYSAPEHMMNSSTPYDERSEIFSFGVVMWEIVTCKEPYDKLKSDDDIPYYMVEKEKAEQVPDLPNLPCKFKDLINKCRSRNTERDLRPSAADLVENLQYIENSIDDQDDN
ncbi:mixed lineage kinase domain-like protein [Amphiura filiformis]|uniref:mixed lineage kinase domain-like protein n=1 Tax=Amphiura filiformis TaxID=82378 RepID=UPI003B20FF23